MTDYITMGFLQVFFFFYAEDVFMCSEAFVLKKKNFFFICHIHNYTEYNQQ